MVTLVVHPSAVMSRSSRKPDFVDVCATSDLEPGMRRLVSIDEREIMLVNVEGEFFAFNAICPHANQSLEKGEIFDYQIECPLHGSMFSLRTGEVCSPPAEDNLLLHKVDVVGSRILVSKSPSR